MYLKLDFGLSLRTDFLTSDVRVLVDDGEGVLLLGLHHPAEPLGHEVQRPVGLPVPHVRHRQKDFLRRAAHGGWAARDAGRDVRVWVLRHRMLHVGNGQDLRRQNGRFMIGVSDLSSSQRSDHITSSCCFRCALRHLPDMKIIKRMRE